MLRPAFCSMHIIVAASPCAYGSHKNIGIGLFLKKSDADTMFVLDTDRALGACSSVSKKNPFILPTNATNARGVKYLNLKLRARHDVFMRQGPAKAVLDTTQGSLDCNMVV